MRQNIHASYHSSEAAARAVGALLDHGVDAQHISAYSKQMPEVWKRVVDLEPTVEVQAKQGITVTSGADALEGAAKGASLGIGVGVLAALASVTIPGFGIVLGGGALGAAATGAVATSAAGAIAGGAYGYLRDQGMSEDTAHYLTEHLEGGGVVVSVAAPCNNVSNAEIEAILSKYAEQEYLGPDTPTMVGPEPIEPEGRAFYGSRDEPL